MVFMVLTMTLVHDLNFLHVFTVLGKFTNFVEVLHTALGHFFVTNLLSSFTNFITPVLRFYLLDGLLEPLIVGLFSHMQVCDVVIIEEVSLLKTSYFGQLSG